ncbi:SRPBCC domain-containing protein [Streptomyces albus]|uniref:SRPBCC domain-containing protein n=1 Tax=Streptomyces albus TaxID=1888 RepID=UPI0004C987F1|nr:SRPBCC domain-containing protein [Streptomyces albus]
MEHEVFVPFPPGTVRQALGDPERVARCVPGFQWDAASGPSTLAGRLRLRAGGSTITYHGTIRLAERDGGELALDAEGTEARGDGSVELALVLRLNAADGGTSLACGGTVRSRGRLAEVDDKAAASAGQRLLDRFAAALAADLEETPVRPAPPSAPAASGENGAGTGRRAGHGDGDVPAPGGQRPGGAGRGGANGGGSGSDGAAPDGRDAGGDGSGKETGPAGGGEDAGGAAGGEGGGLGRADDNEPVIPGIPSPEPGPDAATPAPDKKAGPGEKPGTGEPGPGEDSGPRGKSGAGREAGDKPRGEEPRDKEPRLPGTPEAAGAAAEAGGGTAPEAASVHETEVPPSSLDPLADDLVEADDDTPPAEAAHARRTMIGRSAEEVDHAPPRGRYAPVPAPQPASAGDTLRWAAPVAAALVASAVIVSRVLRRRR